MMKPTADEIRREFLYEPATGHLIRRATGDEAGTVMTCPRGRQFRMATVGPKKKFLTAHLAWVYMTGAWPKETIDHVNGDSLDNSWGNLREATMAEQAQNKRTLKNNALGIAGVRRHNRGYQARVAVDGVSRSKFFASLDEAVAWRREMKAKLHTFNPEQRH